MATNLDTLLLSLALTLQRIAHKAMAMKIEMENETRTFHCFFAANVFVTVNENPLKIASSCIREKNSVPHMLPHWYWDAYASEWTTVTTHHAPLSPPPPPPPLPTFRSKVMCAASSSSSHRQMSIITLWVLRSTAPPSPAHPARLHAWLVKRQAFYVVLKF